MIVSRVEHQEKHFTGSEIVRDVVIGMSDGLTVPFALAAGLSGAVSSANIVLIAGVAEMAAGSIAMGLGGFLAARSELENYHAELERERREVRDLPEREIEEVRSIFAEYGLEGDALEGATSAITSKPDVWVRFMMRNELGLEEPDPRRALRSALTIGGAYIAGGIVPLAPYVFSIPVQTALLASVGVTLVALLVFGGVKARFTGVPVVRGALQTALVGGLAAGAAYLIARLVSSLGGGA
jgi:vacuolar iron transporter family protein